MRSCEIKNCDNQLTNNHPNNKHCKTCSPKIEKIQSKLYQRKKRKEKTLEEARLNKIPEVKISEYFLVRGQISINGNKYE